VHHSVGREKARANHDAKRFCDTRGGGDSADPLYCFTQLEAVAIGKINNARKGEMLREPSLVAESVANDEELRRSGTGIPQKKYGWLSYSKATVTKNVSECAAAYGVCRSQSGTRGGS
jgi:hypothetical protein